MRRDNTSLLTLVDTKFFPLSQIQLERIDLMQEERGKREKVMQRIVKNSHFGYLKTHELCFCLYWKLIAPNLVVIRKILHPETE